MAKGIDCATPLIADLARAIASDGNVFVARYLVPERYSWKRLTRKEAEAITAAGMQIVSVFEASAGRPAGGAAAGEVDGAEAYREARLIGQPEGTAIYFAVDYDAQSADYDAIEQYLLAAAAAIPGYTIGVYGSYAVVKAMFERNAVKRIWQTYAWSRGKMTSHANIYQHKIDTPAYGITVDLNTSYGGEGWWNSREENQPMTNQDKQAFDELRAEVAELRKVIEKQPAPDWFVKEFETDDLDGLIEEPQGSEEFWRGLAITLRAAKAGKLGKCCS